jgi:hypothetical protein
MRKLLICLNALLRQQLEHKGPQTPSRYTTKSEQVIDVELHPAQSLQIAPEDRALRGRTSSADTALQTAAGGRLPAAHQPRGWCCRCKPKAKNPRGFG